jgi:hypothetical protein
VLQKGVGGKNRVVRFDNGSRYLGRRGDGEGKLGLATVVNGETLQKKRSKTGSSTSTSGVEDKESLKTGTVVGQLADSVQDSVNKLLSDGVVTTRGVVGGILLSGDDGLGVVERPVLSTANFVADGGFQIHVDGAGNVLARGSLAEEGVERVVGDADRGITGHHTFGVNAVLEAVEFPTGVTDLNTGLTQMDGNHFTHFV